MSDLSLNLVFSASDMGATRFISDLEKRMKKLSFNVESPRLPQPPRTPSTPFDGYNKSAASVRDAGKGLYNIGSAMERVGRQSQSVLEDIVATGMEFEEALTRTLNAGGSAFFQYSQTLSDEAKRLGTDTRYSGVEVMGAMRGFAQSGMTAQQIIGAMPDTINMAVGGMMELDNAVEIVTNTMSQFGLKSNDTNKMIKNTAMISDMLAKSANVVTADVKDFGTALSYAGTEAALKGMSLQGTLTLLAGLHSRGVSGSRAGSGTRAMMKDLLDISKSDQKILSKLGIAPDDIAAAIAKDDFGKVLQTFNEAFNKKGISGIDVTKTIGPMFSANAESTFLALLDTYQKVDAQGRREFFGLGEDIANSLGEGAKGAATLDKTGGGQIKKFQNQMIDLKLTLADSVLPAVVELAKAVAPMLKQFGAWAAANPELMQSLASLTVKTTAFLVAGGAVTSVFGRFVAGAGYLWSALGMGIPIIRGISLALLTPPLGLITLIASVAAGLIYWAATSDDLVGDLKSLWNTIVDGSAYIIQYLLRPLDGVMERLFGIQDAAKKFTQTFSAAKFDTPSPMVDLASQTYDNYQKLDKSDKKRLDTAFSSSVFGKLYASVSSPNGGSVASETLKTENDARTKKKDQLAVDVNIKVDQDGRVVSANSSPKSSPNLSLLRGLSLEGI